MRFGGNKLTLKQKEKIVAAVSQIDFASLPVTINMLYALIGPPCDSAVYREIMNLIGFLSELDQAGQVPLTKYVAAREVAATLGVSLSTITHRVIDGKIPTYTEPGSSIKRIARTWLEEQLAAVAKV